MRAFIKESSWLNFISIYPSYGFLSTKIPEGSKSYKKYGAISYSRPYDTDPNCMVYLVITLDRELHVITPMGESPFLESHERAFKDLVDADMIEYKNGKYD